MKRVAFALAVIITQQYPYQGQTVIVTPPYTQNYVSKDQQFYDRFNSLPDRGGEDDGSRCYGC